MAESQKRKLLHSTVETRELIRLVQARPCLWERSCPEYRERAIKEKAWLEIYKAVEPDYDDYSEEMKNLIGSGITRKWCNVRDSYVKSRKHNSRNKPYIYAKDLTFLDHLLFDDADFDSRPEKNIENIEEHWFSDVLVVDDDNCEPDAKKSKDVDNVVAVLANLINREEDEDRAFFKSIIPMVKRLSEESKFEFRMQVMNLLRNLSSEKKMCKAVKRERSDVNSDTE